MKKSKTYLIVLTLLLIGGALMIWINRTEEASPNVGNTDVESQLYPEKAITHAHGLAVDAKDSSKIYIATHNGLLLLKDDTDLYRVGKSKDDYMGFSPHPTDANIFFSSGHPARGGNIGFQKSSDAGFTWQKVSNGVKGPVDFHAMAVSPVNSNLIYGWFQGNLQRSIDEGATWEIVNTSIQAGSLVADSRDENILYATGRGMSVSTDKGANWQSLSSQLEDGVVTAMAVHPTEANILLAFSEKLGGLSKSIDSGAKWVKINESFNSETILHIAFDRNNPTTLYAISHENSLYKSNDVGETWSKIR